MAATRLDRAQFLQHPQAVADLGCDRGLHERKTLDLTESGLGHLEDDGGQVGAQDLRFGELGTGVEVLLAVEPDRDPRAEPAAAARPLVGAGPRDRLDRQPLHLGARRVTGDAGRAGVDHEPDARHRDRGLGDVGGQHHPPAGMGLENFLLIRRGQPRVQGNGFPAREFQGAHGIRGVADLPFPGQEDQHVPRGRGGRQIPDGGGDGIHLVVVLTDGPVTDLNGIGAPGDLHDRRVVEVGGEPGGVDGGGCDDHPEFRPALQELFEVAEQEVDVEAAFVCLVDDDRVVAFQGAVVGQLAEQHPVGHHLDAGGAAHPAGETHLIADELPQLRAALLGDPVRDGAGRDPPRLGVGDPLPARQQADLRELGGLARPGFTGDHDHLVVTDEGRDPRRLRGDRQRRVEGEPRLRVHLPWVM